MRMITVAVALATLTAGEVMADPVYIMRAQTGAYAGKVLPSNAFPMPAPPNAAYDFQSFDFVGPGLSRTLSLATLDRLEIDPAGASLRACSIYPNSGGYSPTAWLGITHSEQGGRYEPYVWPVAVGRIAISVHCPRHGGGAAYYYDIEIVN
jgi:hypothetical protein